MRTLSGGSVISKPTFGTYRGVRTLECRSRKNAGEIGDSSCIPRLRSETGSSDSSAASASTFLSSFNKGHLVASETETDNKNVLDNTIFHAPNVYQRRQL